jgi:hypothetical protein
MEFSFLLFPKWIFKNKPIIQQKSVEAAKGAVMVLWISFNCQS